MNIFLWFYSRFYFHWSVFNSPCIVGCIFIDIYHIYVVNAMNKSKANIIPSLQQKQTQNVFYKSGGFLKKRV